MWSICLSSCGGVYLTASAYSARKNPAKVQSLTSFKLISVVPHDVPHEFEGGYLLPLPFPVDVVMGIESVVIIAVSLHAPLAVNEAAIPQMAIWSLIDEGQILLVDERDALQLGGTGPEDLGFPVPDGCPPKHIVFVHFVFPVHSTSNPKLAAI